MSEAERKSEIAALEAELAMREALRLKAIAAVLEELRQQGFTLDAFKTQLDAMERALEESRGKPSMNKNPPFAVTCQDIVAHAYRDTVDIYGNHMTEEWTTDERFNAVWKFVYRGGEDILVDDEVVHVIAEHPGVIIAVSGSDNGKSAGMLGYIINLEMKKVILIEGTAFGVIGSTAFQGVKGRVANLECKFAFNSTQPPALASNWTDIVMQAQRLLKTFKSNSLYNPGPVNGVLGLQTRKALVYFQISSGLPVTGNLDKATRKELNIE